MPRHKKGTLVQVKESALKPMAAYYAVNINAVANHGYLWLVEDWAEDSDTYICKSVATGEEEPWFPKEITARLPKEQPDGRDV